MLPFTNIKHRVIIVSFALMACILTLNSCRYNRAVKYDKHDIYFEYWPNWKLYTDTVRANQSTLIGIKKKGNSKPKSVVTVNIYELQEGRAKLLEKSQNNLGHIENIAVQKFSDITKNVFNGYASKEYTADLKIYGEPYAARYIAIEQYGKIYIISLIYPNSSRKKILKEFELFEHNFVIKYKGNR